MPRYELKPTSNQWKWVTDNRGNAVVVEAVLRLQAHIDKAMQVCELRLSKDEIRSLLSLPQVKDMARQMISEESCKTAQDK